MSATPALASSSHPMIRSARNSRSTGTLAFGASASSGAHIPSHASGRNEKKRRLSKTIRAPLKSASSKFARVSSRVWGKKPSSKTSKKLAKSTSYSRCESCESSRTSGSPGSLVSPIAESSEDVAESIGASIDTLDVSRPDPGKEATQFTTLQVEVIDCSTHLTPLEFDEAEVTNHFRDDDYFLGPTAPTSPHGVAALPTLLSMEKNSSASSDSEEYELFLKVVDSVSSLIDLEKNIEIPPVLPLLEDHQGSVDTEDCDHSVGALSLGDSNHSIPSLSEDVPASLDQVIQGAPNKENGADSVLAFGCLTAILGSPAPQSVLCKEKKVNRRTPVNLWQEDGEAMPQELDEVVLSQDHVVNSPAEEPPEVNQEEINRRKFRRALKKAMKRRKSGRGSTPETFQNSYNFFSSKWDPKNEAPNEIHLPLHQVGAQDESGEDAVISSHINSSIAPEEGGMVQPGHVEGTPTRDPEVEACDDMASDLSLSMDADMCAPLESPLDVTSTKESADSALVWGCLSALLGAPAPESVLLGEKKKRRRPVNLWLADDEDDCADEIISLPNDDAESVQSNNPAEDDLKDVSDTCSMPSLHPEDTHLGDAIPDMRCPCDLELQITAPAPNESADNDVLAWGALVAILGSPAPMNATRKSSKKESIIIWGDGPESESIPDIEKQDCKTYDHDEETESLGMPSIDLNGTVSNEQETNFSFNEFIDGKDDKKAGADTTLAWGALGMLLGAPAPKIASKKSSRVSKDVVKNLWAETGIMGDDGLESIPSIDRDEDDVHSLPSLLQISDNNVPNMVDMLPADTLEISVHNIFEPDDETAVRGTSSEQFASEEEFDTHSIPSLSGTCDDGECSSGRLTRGGSETTSFDGSITPPRKASTSKDLAESAFAWGALAACLGSPAPKSVLCQKGKKKIKNLWLLEGNGEVTEMDDTSLALGDH